MDVVPYDNTFHENGSAEGFSMLHIQGLCTMVLLVMEHMKGCTGK
jgi:hypothetical protein